jgi:integral membrane protein
MAEAASFLLLLGVAMPVKYLLGEPLPVRIVGWVHGGLFVLYCWALFEATVDREWPLSKSAKLLVAALLPFGPFVLDRGLKREQLG